MDTLGYIISFTLLGSVVSLIGGVLLLAREKLALRISHLLSSFAAGVLLATAFMDLLPEAMEHASEGGLEVNIFMWAFMGVLTFFLIERFIHWFHHHHSHGKIESKEEKNTIIPLIVIGDSVHNFVDGVVIAAAFLVDISLGIITTFAVAAHEIPQEIGDFGIMLHRGVKRTKILTINFLSACSALVGALLAYFLGEGIEGILPIFLSLAAGFFIYISLSDLIPEIHSEDNRKVAFLETVILITGALVVWLSISVLHSFIAH